MPAGGRSAADHLCSLALTCPAARRVPLSPRPRCPQQSAPLRRHAGPRRPRAPRWPPHHLCSAPRRSQNRLAQNLACITHHQAHVVDHARVVGHVQEARQGREAAAQARTARRTKAHAARAALRWAAGQRPMLLLRCPSGDRSSSRRADARYGYPTPMRLLNHAAGRSAAAPQLVHRAPALSEARRPVGWRGWCLTRWTAARRRRRCGRWPPPSCCSS